MNIAPIWLLLHTRHKGMSRRQTNNFVTRSSAMVVHWASYAYSAAGAAPQMSPPPPPPPPADLAVSAFS